MNTLTFLKTYTIGTETFKSEEDIERTVVLHGDDHDFNRDVTEMN